MASTLYSFELTNDYVDANTKTVWFYMEFEMPLNSGYEATNGFSYNTPGVTGTATTVVKGPHVSLGSRALGALASDSRSGFNEDVEKHCGDLVIKIVEHFLPLFVGTYSAAPYRIDFRDFHPENVLGFLPHELDYTHLRMIWRRWKKKAKIGFLGRSMTPFGPRWLASKLMQSCRISMSG